MPDPIDTAWKLHSAQMEWTGKVDAKAGFILTLDAAAITTSIALSSEGMVFHGVSTGQFQLLYDLSILLFVTAAVLAAWAVAPALRLGNLKEEAKSNFIYFGHARFWDPDDLATALEEHDPLSSVTRQVVRMSTIAWRKHCRVAWSTWLTVAGVIVIALTGFVLS